MAKIFLGVTIVVFASLFGKRFTEKYWLKLKYFECLKRFNLHLKQNMLHKKDNLIELLDFKCDNEEFVATISSFKLNKLNESQGEEIYFPYWTEEKDRTFLREYFESLGKSNVGAEYENILAQQTIIDEKVCEIAYKSSKFSKLGQKLGFAFGMAVFILIL